MAHGIYRVTAFVIVGPSSLLVEFDDGMSRVIDFKPVLAGELYGALGDTDFFNKVRLDSEVGTLVWPNGADFDPATLHDWPELADEIAEMVRRWRSLDEKRSTG
jgi:hypothetical protein